MTFFNNGLQASTFPFHVPSSKFHPLELDPSNIKPTLNKKKTTYIDTRTQDKSKLKFKVPQLTQKRQKPNAKDEFLKKPHTC